jgi:hypothetical protein
MVESLVLKQDQAKALHIVSNTYGKHNTSALQISAIFNCHRPTGGCFGGLVVDITTKTAMQA